MDYTTSALFGSQGSNSYLPASMMNPSAAGGETDWGAILTNGIRGAAQGAIGGLVAEKVASGQLVYTETGPQAAYQQRPVNLMPWLIIGGLAYVLTRG